jgi:hypothetical protein
MREQADVVETELARRISETSDAMQKMTDNMREVIYQERFYPDRNLYFNLDIKSDC